MGFALVNVFQPRADANIASVRGRRIGILRKALTLPDASRMM